MRYILGLKGKLQHLRANSGPPAPHRAEASLVSNSGMTSLTTAFCFAAWSSKMPPANIGAVLSMLDGPEGCDPAFHVVWAWFHDSWVSCLYA